MGNSGGDSGLNATKELMHTMKDELEQSVKLSEELSDNEETEHIRAYLKILNMLDYMLQHNLNEIDPSQQFGIKVEDRYGNYSLESKILRGLRYSELLSNYVTIANLHNVTLIHNLDGKNRNAQIGSRIGAILRAFQTEGIQISDLFGGTLMKPHDILEALQKAKKESSRKSRSRRR